MTGAMVPLHLRPEARRRMICFSFAGGGVATFRRWTPALPNSVELWGVCYPGREHRFGEPLPERWGDLVDECHAAVRPHLQTPLLLYGHSMGALMAFEVARRLGDDADPRTCRLIVSGHKAPQRSLRPHPHVRSPTDAELLAWMRETGGVARSVLDNPDVSAHALQLLRADLAVYMQYRWAGGPRLRLDVHVLHGEEDRVSPVDAAAWHEVTDGLTTVQALPGGHFFTPDLWAGLPRHLPLDS